MNILSAFASACCNAEFDDSTMPSEQESDEFMKHLSELRQHAETFLTILNDMRKRLKTLQSDSESTKQCK